MKYEIISDGEMRALPTMEKPDPKAYAYAPLYNKAMNRYEKHLASLPTYPHRLSNKVGDIVEEGVDFVWDFDLENFPNDYSRKIAIPKEEQKPTEESMKEKALRLCKVTFPHGDSYYAEKTKTGKWKIGYTNDYPMQHGDGQHLIVPEEMIKAFAPVDAERFTRKDMIEFIEFVARWYSPTENDTWLRNCNGYIKGTPPDITEYSINDLLNKYLISK